MQLVQVNRAAQRRAESGKRLCRVILAPVKALINHALDAPAQGLEQRRDYQGEITMMALFIWPMNPRKRNCSAKTRPK